MCDSSYRLSRLTRKSNVVVQTISSTKLREHLPQAWARRWLKAPAVVMFTMAVLLWPSLALGQGSPWERAASNLEFTFTGPLARSLALVSIVIGGLMFMFGEGGAKRQISGIVFGGGLALFAAQFMTWLF